MVSIKTWEEFKLSRRHGCKLIVYGSENKESYIDFFGDNLYFCDNNTLDSDDLIYSGKTYEVISLSQLVNFDEELDIIISPQISYKEVMKLTRCFIRSTYEVLLFLGKRHEGIVVNGNTLDFKSALLLNYNVDKIYSDIPIPFYKYFQVIDDQISKAYDVMINYKKNYSIKDYEGEYVNHLFGKRVTCYQPQNYDHYLHIFGDSRVYSYGSEDKFTFCSLLQKKINENNLKIKVENHGMFDDSECFLGGILNRISTLELKQNDIVIYCLPIHWPYIDCDIEKSICFLLNEIRNKCVLSKTKFVCVKLPSIFDVNQNTDLEKFFISEIKGTQEEKQCLLNLEIKSKINDLLKVFSLYKVDIQKCFNKPCEYTEVFLDHIHYLKSGNELVAKELFEELNAHVFTEENSDFWMGQTYHFPQKMMTNCIQKLSEKVNQVYDSEVYNYLQSIEKNNSMQSNIVGSIVVNCNPFTNGHLKLIEYAAKQVDYLYVFVVEEDSSYFSFKDRMYLVKENTKHIKNVIVNASGRFIISKVTFPAYFDKEISKDKIIDCANDLLIFGSNIAPPLNITKRFIGEEPFCNVTRQYNEKMKEILPRYQIGVIEIERFSFDDEYISASKVRKLYKENDFKKIKVLVPQLTYDYLISNRQKENIL